MPAPLAYLLTWRCYGTWLPGDDRGSVTHDNRPGAPFAAPSPALAAHAPTLMQRSSFLLDAPRRALVRGVIEDVCTHRGWSILALNVRTTHVHAVVKAEPPPEKVLVDLKAWSTRRLREAGLCPQNGKVWAAHGSTRWIDTQASLDRVIEYTLHEQGPVLDPSEQPVGDHAPDA